MFTLVGFLAVFFQVDGDEDELEVGEEGGVEPVVAGGGLAVVLHAVEDAFHDVAPLVRPPVVVPWVRAVPLGGTTGVRPNDSASRRVESPSWARPPGSQAPMDAPSAAIERRPWAASHSLPGLKWISTSVDSLSDTT